MGKLSSRIDCESGCSAPPPAPCITRASRITPSEGAAPQKNDATVKIVTQISRKRLRPKRRANQFDAGRITALATRYEVSTQVASEFDADKLPAIYGSATEAMAVSSTSMNVASHGFTPWVSG